MFHQDLNSDGVVSAANVIATDTSAFGSTSLAVIGANYYIYGANSSAPIELKYQGAPYTIGTFPGFSLVGAVQNGSGGYDVAWANPGSNQYGVWIIDSNGNEIFGPALSVPAASTALQSFESIFHQDLNGDGAITSPVMSQTDSSTTLEQIGSNYFIYSGAGWAELQYNGAPYTNGTFPGFSLIGAVQNGSGGYDVAWANPSANKYGIWVIDSNGNEVSAPVLSVSATNLTLESFESLFHQDLNGDGAISPADVIATDTGVFGTASLDLVGTNYYIYAAAGGTGAELKYQGAPYTVGQFGTAWSPIGAVQNGGGGYYVAWGNPSSNQYGVWSTDSNGNQVSSVLAPTSGTSPAIQSFESIFHQDLNGDGVITSPAMSRTNGSTTLEQVGSNYFIYGGGNWTELQYNGAPYTIGTFPGWSVIGAVQTGSSGYDVAWANQGANQYGIWVIDGGGNLVSSPVANAPATNAIYESFENIFGQDLNGDGHVGLAVATGGTLEVPGAEGGGVTFLGSTGTLKLDTPQSFTGQITGFTGDGTLAGSDQIDLTNLAYNSSVQSNSSYNSSTGTLTVGNGTATDLLHFVGSYTFANFKFASDGHGGTIVYDPPTTDSTGGDTTDSQLNQFIQAMGTYSGSSGFDPAMAAQVAQDQSQQANVASAWHH